MYSACIFCNKSLGANETFETFPVGKRLAFDAAKGRLWVVCSTCERWNLSPLEERWEAIELAERLYCDARRRVSTDNVGLAKLRDGTTLVRIGDPLRPEFAAWRYGDQFGRRRNRQMLIAGAGVAIIGSVVVGGIVTGASIGAFSGIYGGLGQTLIRGRANTIIANIQTENGVVAVRRRHLAETSLAWGDDARLVLELRHVMADDSREQKRIGPRYGNGRTRLEGRDAERAAAVLVPKVNRFGAAKRGVADAVDEIERAGSAEAYLTRIAKLCADYTESAGVTRRRGFFRERADMSSGLFGLPKEHRLALEMALHEEAERRALDGELEELERAWRDAEEVAAISDNLFLPESVTAKIADMR
jgi:hypothetical protein